MFCKESLGLELFWNRSVHKFYCLEVLITLEQVNTLVVEKKKKNLNFSKRLTGQVSYASYMSLVMSMWFNFGTATIEMMFM